MPQNFLELSACNNIAKLDHIRHSFCAHLKIAVWKERLADPDTFHYLTSSRNERWLYWAILRAWLIENACFLKQHHISNFYPGIQGKTKKLQMQVYCKETPWIHYIQFHRGLENLYPRALCTYFANASEYFFWKQLRLCFFHKSTAITILWG